MEKSIQNLESDNRDLACELKSLQQARNESESRRKKVESQLQELLSRAAEAERTKAEQSQRSGRLQVPGPVATQSQKLLPGPRS